MKINHSGILYILHFFLFIWNLLKHFCTVTLCIKLFAFTRLILMFHQSNQQNISFFNKNLHSSAQCLKKLASLSKEWKLKTFKTWGTFVSQVAWFHFICVCFMRRCFISNFQTFTSTVFYSYFLIIFKSCALNQAIEYKYLYFICS